MAYEGCKAELRRQDLVLTGMQRLCLLCQSVVQLRQGNVDSTGITATAELLLPPGVANTYCLHSVKLLDLSLQFQDALRFPNHNGLVTRKIACIRQTMKHGVAGGIHETVGLWLHRDIQTV